MALGLPHHAELIGVFVGVPTWHGILSLSLPLSLLSLSRSLSHIYRSIDPSIWSNLIYLRPVSTLNKDRQTPDLQHGFPTGLSTHITLPKAHLVCQTLWGGKQSPWARYAELTWRALFLNFSLEILSENEHNTLQAPSWCTVWSQRTSEEEQTHNQTARRNKACGLYNDHQSWSKDNEEKEEESETEREKNITLQKTGAILEWQNPWFRTSSKSMFSHRRKEKT